MEKFVTNVKLLNSNYLQSHWTQHWKIQLKRGCKQTLISDVELTIPLLCIIKFFGSERVK